MPYGYARALGPLGDAIASQRDDVLDWDRRMQECKARANAG